MNVTLKREVIDNLVIPNEKHKNIANFENSNQLIENYVKEKNRSKLKLMCRCSKWSILNPIRVKLWLQLSSAYKKTNLEPNFQDCDLESNRHSNFNQEFPPKLPSFIDPNYCRFFFLNSKGQRTVEKVLWCLAVKHNEITTCPLLYPLAALFLHYFDIQNTLISLTYLLDAPSSGIGDTDSRFLLPQSKTQLEKEAYVLIKLTSKFGFLPRRGFFYEQRENLAKNQEIDACFYDWLKWIFIGLPFEHLVRIVDCFLVEGTKFLYRIALTLLQLYKKFRPVGTLMQSSPFTLEIMLNFCSQIKLNPDELISLAINVTRLSRSKINRIYNDTSKDHKLKSHSSSNSHITDILTTSRKKEMLKLESIRISEVTRIAPQNFKSSIVDWFMLDIIWDWLPERLLIQEPLVVFCTNQDGNSLSTFFAKVESYDQIILLIKTFNNQIFGAFCSSSWKERFKTEGREKSGQYFGTGETFLFTLKPKVCYYPWVGARDFGENRVKNLTHSHQLFMAANQKSIIIGGGQGLGLFLDDNLTKGKSEKCLTFDNEPLSSPADFTCCVIEAIGFIA